MKQMAAMKAIQEGTHVHGTTLQAVRDQYTDLLADFHCLDKTHYTLTFPCKSQLYVLKQVKRSGNNVSN
jgi:hypothetical protein